MEMPHSEMDEVILIGSILTSKEDFYEVINELPADAFFIQEHYDLYRHLEIINKHGYKPTPATLIQILRDNNLLEACHGELFIRNLMLHASVNKQSDVKYHLERVLSLYNKRLMLKLADDIKKDVSSSEDIYELQNRYAQKISALSSSKSDKFVSAESLVKDFEDGKSYLQVVDERIYNKKNNIDNFKGFRTGYPILDSYFGGFGNGHSTIIGARSNSGKTTLVANLLLLNKELYPDSRIGFFTLEMSRQNILEKLAAAYQGMIYDNLVEGDVTSDERIKMNKTADFLEKSGFYFYDKPGLSVSKAFSLIRKAIINEGLQMIFTDYLTILKPDKQTGNVYQDADQLSKAIQAMSREFKIPFITLAQLSRKPADRIDKTPQVSDLRNAGSIEEDADNIILLNRPALYDKTKPDFTELYLVKNRYRSRFLKTTLQYERGRLWELPPIEQQIEDLKD